MLDEFNHVPNNRPPGLLTASLFLLVVMVLLTTVWYLFGLVWLCLSVVGIVAYLLMAPEWGDG